MSTNEIATAEAEIDEAFAQNELATLPFAKSAWTLLSVTEDHHFNIAVLSPLKAPQAAIYVDGLMNSLTYPLRVCHVRSPKGPCEFKRELVDREYELAVAWLDHAEDYSHFSTIFPLYHSGRIKLEIQGKTLVPTDWSQTELSYEVYDRFISKRNPEGEEGLNPNLVAAEIAACMRSSGGEYSIEFSRKLMLSLDSAFAGPLNKRHSLPDGWKFSAFTISQYRSVFVTLQCMAYAWFVARQIAVSKGARALAYPSAVWTPRKGLLIATIARHTILSKSMVSGILRYLTFGEMNIRCPDIAIQPIVDLSNDQFAISPFVMTNVHAERNLCVLLNQIPEDRILYSKLVDEKEAQLRTEMIESLSGLGLDFRHGSLSSTDVDLAVIDRDSKVCLCIEMKWFIEPAEVREILARSEELQKGVTQALKITALFKEKDARLFQLLSIDETYDFQAMVGSVNFIGDHHVQHINVPITKLWHLAAKIVESRSLATTLSWLRQREYLPRKDTHFKINEVPISSGAWCSRWYGITYA